MDLQVRGLRLDTGRPKICAPLAGKTFNEILEQASQAKKCAQLIEWRADHYEDIRSEESLLMTLLALRDELRELPLIFNLRTRNEGGQADLTLHEYRRINEFAVSSKTVDVADIALAQVDNLGPTFLKWIQALDVKVMLSDYSLEKTPENAVLLFRLNMMEHLGADIGKLVVQPTSESDVLRIMEMTLKAQSFVSLPFVTIATGKLGKLSRVAGVLNGSCLTYGCLSEKTSADGQIELEKLQAFMKEFG